MTFRPFLLAAALLTSIPHVASASELRLSVGGGAVAAYSDPCGYDGNCNDPRIQTSGAAPLILAGIRGHIPLKGNWRLRIGGTASALLIAGTDGDRGSVATGAGEFGVERGRFAADLIMGISVLRLTADDMTRSGGTFMTGGSLTARITPTIAAFGRIDLHAMMHAPIGGAFVGVGLEWTPAL